MKFSKNILIIVWVMIICASLMVSGCAYQNTDGVTRKVLPLEVGFVARLALASGETEQRVGVGKNAVGEVMAANTGFNETRKAVGVAEANNKDNFLAFAGPQQSATNLSLTTEQRVLDALAMKKEAD